MTADFFCMSCGIRFKGEHKLYEREPMTFHLIAHAIQGKDPCRLPLGSGWLYPVRPVLQCPSWAAEMRRQIKKAIRFEPAKWSAR